MAAKTPFFTNNANMRFDKLDTALALNRRQLLFVETWFNEVHEFSVDAFRVRAMNPELFASMTLPANDSRIAGMRVAAHIEQVLDVRRYDFLKQNFTLSDSFLVEKEEGRHILLPILKTVPNCSRQR